MSRVASAPRSGRVAPVVEVLEVTVAPGRLGAGGRVDVNIPGASPAHGVVFSAVPDGRTLRCRLALENADQAQLQALVAALAR